MEPRPVNEPRMTQFVLGIIAACLVVRFLSVIQYPEPSTEPFLLAHTLDPTSAEDRQYRNWGSEDWVRWLNRRTPLHTAARARFVKPPSLHPSGNKKEPSVLNAKPLNTVVIATPAEINDAFTGRLENYGNGMVWSNRKFPTYMFDYSKARKGYAVYRCPDTFIVVLLKTNKPVHLQTFSDVRITSANANWPFKKKCTLL